MLRSIRFQTKLFAYFSALIVVLIIVSVSLLYLYMIRTATDRSLESLKQLTQKSSEQLDTMLQNMDAIALQIMNNSVVLDAFREASRSDANPNVNFFEENYILAKKTADMLMSINGPKISMARISLFNFDGDFINYGILPETASSGYAHVHRKDIAEYRDRLITDEKHRLILPPHPDYWSDDPDQILISVVRLIQDTRTGEIYGVAEIQQPYPKFAKLTSELQNIEPYWLDSTGALFLPYDANASARSEDDQRLKLYNRIASEQPNRIVKLNNPTDGTKEFMSSITSEESGFRLAFVQTERSLISPFVLIGRMLWLIGACVTVATIMAIYFLSRQLAKPIKELRQSIKHVSLDNLSIDLQAKAGNDEIILLNRAFNTMFRKLEFSIQHEFKAHLLALQSQMNPHFLYNTLALISAVGQEQGNIRIMEMCRKLSDMLRYTSAFNENDITLAKEAEHAKAYLELMKERYEDYFTYSITVDEGALDIKAPKLVLQPLIENCFQHGFAKISPPWYIDIAIGKNERHWYIEVRDNGGGFLPETIKEIQRKAASFTQNPFNGIQDLKLNGLGLLNTYVRLYMLYAEDMIFDIREHEPQGAIIRIGGNL